MKDLISPTTQQLEEELDHVNYRVTYRKSFRGTIWTLVVVAAAAIILSTFFLSVLKIQGNSMDPLLKDGEFVIAMKTNDFNAGDIIAFYYNNKVLLKRAIAYAGDIVDIDEDGNVFVNGQELDEPYILDKALGDGDVKFPYQVPDSRWFVLGDHRSTSSDSLIGTVAEEQIVGKVVLRVWPLSEFAVLD
ncbi:MAG: signal peptidase I [Firmicutes bacterium HGW-Firmicutes-16]|nr:MAG: signal peptidase I [Firmicutes bacterium HGW-Firmicutes-16]